MNKNTRKGVSVIICCYNSSGRIRETLDALAKQQFTSTVFWEIILVDNASADNTAAVARAIWEDLGSGTRLRIVTEPQPGLGNARMKGISEARYSTLLFCDDDNWLAPQYVQGMYEILDNNPAIAACGGKGIPVFETAKPYWFDEYAETFATGSQEMNSEHGRLLNLYGAGLAIRKHALEQLYRSGFKPVMQGRVGKKLSSAEDTELTYALVLMGYTLYYAEELTFAHYLPEERLTFNYLKKIFIAFGTDGPVRNLYYARLSNRFFHKQIGNWNFHLALCLFRLFKYLIVSPKKYGRMIYFNWNMAYIKQLFAIRRDYRKIIGHISAIKKVTHYKPVEKVEHYLSVVTEIPGTQ
jgi:glycosyltransferase involved in cell wall biosynthesis